MSGFSFPDFVKVDIVYLDGQQPLLNPRQGSFSTHLPIKIFGVEPGLSPGIAKDVLSAVPLGYGSRKGNTVSIYFNTRKLAAKVVLGKSNQYMKYNLYTMPLAARPTVGSSFNHCISRPVFLKWWAPMVSLGLTSRIPRVLLAVPVEPAVFIFCGVVGISETCTYLVL